jgi:Na+/phosphate symporter
VATATGITATRHAITNTLFDFISLSIFIVVMFLLKFHRFRALAARLAHVALAGGFFEARGRWSERVLEP